MGGEVDGYDGMRLRRVLVRCTLVMMASGVQWRSTPVGVGVEEHLIYNALQEALPTASVTEWYRCWASYRNHCNAKRGGGRVVLACLASRARSES